MACRSCSTGLGSLSKRLALPLETTLLPSSAPRSSATRQISSLPLSSSPSRSSSPLSTQPSSIIPPTRRWLSTTSPNRGLKDKLLGGIAKSLAANKSSYFVYGATERAYKHCAGQAEYTIDPAVRKNDTLQHTADGEEIGVSQGGVWHKELSLLPTFSTWSHVTMLHMYLLVVRYRCFPPELHQAWQSGIVNHFFFQAESKMEDVHAITSRALRQRYLKDLFVQWRGVILAYDEGLVKGDAVLAEAVWRNLFKGREDVDLRALAAVVAWMRAGVKRLGGMEDEEVEMDPRSGFADLAAQFGQVDVPVAELRTAFQKAGLKE